MKRIFGIVLCLALALPMMAQEETLCMDGTLLFREDFGGNDPNDPRVGATPVNGMTYRQLLTDAWQSMGSGKYLVTKSGYCNGDTSVNNLPQNRRSQWHLQDDHTYPNDRTRGYLLEIDARADNAAFYQTTIERLCEGTELTFSAYVANVMTWGQYMGRPGMYAYPRLKFVLTNPTNNSELATYDTGDIPFDSAFINDYNCWQESSKWQLVGMNFTVPVGVEAIQLSIYNNVDNAIGNDFALDDIEIRLCAPPVTIEGETEVCENTATTLTANFTNDGTFAEPLEYKWWYSADSLTWTEMSDFNGEILTLNAIQKADSGWYKVAVSSDGNIENINCRAMSEPFLLTVKECVPLLPVTITIISPDSVCPNDPYTFEVVIENEDQLEAPTDFQWWYRSPEYPTVWNKVSGGNQRDLQIASFKAQHVGWYKLQAAGHGLIDIEQYCVESEEYYVTFKKCEPDLCLDGSLLYRDDFGGNDPNDPEVISDANAARAAVPGMSTNYTPCLSRTSGMSSGKFLITKQGYKNGIQWHLMDDHTYPEDLTKGYILQIDGRGDDVPFYTTTIDGLCSGSRLTFSAYVVNVHYCGEIQKFYRLGQSYIYPRMKFVLKDPQNGQTLATQYTDDIQPDANKEWDINLGESAEWRLIGMEFTVPEGVESIQMYIYNDVNHNGTGNDFALDDIEIHLCAPPVTIEGETEVCENTATTLTANFTNDGTFAEPLEYKWWHSTDSVTWTEIADFNGGILTFSTIQKADSGWYKVAVSGDGNIESVNCRAMSEPFRLRVNECEPPTPLTPELCIDGTLLFREDFGGNDPNDPQVSTQPVSGMTYTQVFAPETDAPGGNMRGGCYLVTKKGYRNSDNKNYSCWHIMDDHTYPNDKTRGYLMEVDALGSGNNEFFCTTIDGLCAGNRLTFSAYVANLTTAGQYLAWISRNYVHPKLSFIITDPDTNTELARYNTDTIGHDWGPSVIDGSVRKKWQESADWQLVGMNFTVPEGVYSVRLAIRNNALGSTTGNDFALDDIEIHLCAPPVTIEGEAEVCTNTSTTLTANFTNDGTFAEPLVYKWWHSTDSLTWTEISGFNGEILSFDAIQKADSGWYKVAVSGNGNIESVNCRAVSEPFRLRVNECEPPEPPEPPTPPVPPCPEVLTVTADTTVCDTLMPFTWRGMVFEEEGEKRWMEKSPRDCDSIEHVLTLSTIHCEKPEPPEPPTPPVPPCPEVLTVTADTTVCDTLMPFTWRGLVFEEAGEKRWMEKSPRDCDSIEHVLTLSTTHCEKPEPPEPPDPPLPPDPPQPADTLFEIIVNKYNWQLLCNNVALRGYFPGQTATAFQWYKNEQAIPGATGDDYSEHNELQGVFQLNVRLDDGRSIWSNIIEIEGPEDAPARVQIYNSQGMPVSEGQMTRGVNLYRYVKGEEVWTEKKIVL